MTPRCPTTPKPPTPPVRKPTTETDPKTPKLPNVETDPKKPPTRGTVDRRKRDLGTITAQARTVTFRDPWELFQRMQEYLGLLSAEPEPPKALPTFEQLAAKDAGLNNQYRKCQDAKRKLAIRNAIREIKLDTLMRNFQIEDLDYRARRRAFLTDLLDSLVAIMVANSWDSIFECNVVRMKDDFVRILKAMPADEVAPSLWQTLSDQVRYTGSPAEPKIRKLEEQRREAQRRIRAIRYELKRKPSDKEAARLQHESDQLKGKLKRLEFDRIILRASRASRNRRFNDLAREIVVGIGAPAAPPVLTGIHDKDLRVVRSAGMIVRLIGEAAMPALIDAQTAKPKAELAHLFGAIAGRRMGTDPKVWVKWLENRKKKVTQPPKRKAAPEDVDSAEEPEEPEEILIKPREDNLPPKRQTAAVAPPEEDEEE